MILEIFENLKGTKSTVKTKSLLQANEIKNLPYYNILVNNSNISTKGLVQLGTYIEQNGHTPSCVRCKKEFISIDGNWNLITDFCGISCRKKKDQIETSSFNYSAVLDLPWLETIVTVYEEIKKYKGTPFVFFLKVLKQKQLLEAESHNSFVANFSYLNTSVFIILCKFLLREKEFIKCYHCLQPYKVRQNSNANDLVYEGYCSRKCRFSSKIIKSKIRATCLSRFGTTSNLVAEGAKRSKQRKQEFFQKAQEKAKGNNVTLHCSEEDYKGCYNNTYNFSCNTCGFRFERKTLTITDSNYMCRKCFPYCRSSQEVKVYNFLRKLLKEEEDIITNSRKIVTPLELDIYLPKLQLAIEVDGHFYHGNHKGSHKRVDVKDVRRREAPKNNLCEEKGIKLLRFTDIEINKEWERVCSKIEEEIQITNILPITN